jgi:phosphatidylserine/phosphatidylglycerophosphate/cardiolipin synthase-like enzyme
MIDIKYLDNLVKSSHVRNYPPVMRTLFATVDEVHPALLYLLKGADHSIDVAMYGFDDDEAMAIMETKLTDPNFFVRLTLDKSQAGGVHEADLLKKWHNDEPGNSIAIGHSEKGAIMHLKCVILDKRVVVTGSTNWSTSGEQKQDNTFVVIDDYAVAAQHQHYIDLIHTNMLQQMAKGTS